MIEVNIPYVFKKCTKCGEIKLATNEYFSKRKDGKYGLRGCCKTCEKERRKKYYEQNKEHIKEREKEYYENNKDRYKEYKKEYYEQNKEREKERSKKYRKQNKEKMKEYDKKYYEQNKDKKLEYRKEYYEQNKDKIKEYHKEYHKKYYEQNKDEIKERKNKWRKTPKGQVSIFNSSNKRRAKEDAQGGGITSNQWLEMMQYFQFKCAYSGETLTKKTRTLDHIISLNKGGKNDPWNIIPMYGPYNFSKRDKDLLEWYQQQPFYSEERLQKIYEWQEYAYKKYANKI